MNGQRATTHATATSLALLAAWLVCQTTVRIVLGYGDYFPPNFRSDFLLGREGTFFGGYQWAFYAHIVSGPFCLSSGLALLFERAWAPRRRLHRLVGKAHMIGLLFVMAPSGLWMSAYAATGRVAGFAFAVQAVLTAAFALLGWRSAVRREFSTHRIWMQRTFAMLTAAVVLRLIGGASEVLGLEGVYPYSAWASWLLPLGSLEIARWVSSPMAPGTLRASGSPRKTAISGSTSRGIH
ncbi:hypothetical protein Pla123a_08650 [Posidoniimonas polymericola]|uniref:DUF2306 domain-containing protein n=1 Tax=Posidoniimonas polymericola TaxID=2528002 RepID=A0A5C5YTE0_9BACT|nr:DUF2306 domain-containing protein [Posidoniimonas polymericola]TWT78076.1 hypothetical protein Pla123a_08650 [Posidoniimonas polymericola]